MPRRLLLLLCVLIAARGARGNDVAPLEMLYRNWNFRDGLPHDSVEAIIQTHDGYLWVGTDGGLARFDGVRFEKYGLREGLPAVTVRALFESSDGTLWVGTIGGGLSAIRNGKVVRTYTRESGLPSVSVDFITEDEGKHLWAGSTAGLARLDGDRFIAAMDLPVKKTVNALFCEHKGTIWWTDPDILWRSEGDHWVSATAEGGPPGGLCFCEDDQGRLWIGSKRKLWCRGPEGWQSYDIPESISGADVISIAASRDGTIWGVMESGEICGLRNAKFIEPFPRVEKGTHLAVMIYAANDGQLWVGSESQGLFALTSPRTGAITIPGSKGNNMIYALAEKEPGTLVIGTETDGWFQWRDGQIGRLSEEGVFLTGTYCNALHTRDGSLWTAGDGGLTEFHDGRKIPHPALETLFTEQTVLGLCQDHTGGIWAGTARGQLYHIESGVPHLTPYGGALQAILALTEDTDGTLWIGTRGDGLYCWRGLEHRHFGQKEGIPCNVIRAIYIAGDGTLWIGTAGGGLARREGDGFVSVSTMEGLPDDIVSQITDDNEGRLWLGTNRGLVVLSTADLDSIHAGRPINLHPLTVTAADGLLAESCMTVPPVKTSSGQFAFATTNGVALVRPGDFHAEELTFPV